MAISGQAASRDHDQSWPGQQVAVQLAVQGWAITRSGRPSRPDDPCDPTA
jgi:hypothetical protein